MNWQQLKAEIGVRTRGISVMIDLVAGCTFACPSCPVGNLPTRKGKPMAFDLYTKIMDRIEEQVKVRYVLLYSFSEPFLSPILSEVVFDLKKRGINRVMISTNLSRPKQLESVLNAGLDELRISFSGFKNGEYFHAGRDMRQFIYACDRLAEIAPKYHTKVGLIFHRYATNLDELPMVEWFAREHGFELIPETAFFIPFETIVSKSYTEADRVLLSHLIQTPEQTTANLKYNEFCYYQSKQIVIDSGGKVFLCRHVYGDEFIVGDILKDDIHDIRKEMMNTDFCVSCKAHKLNTGGYTP